MIFFLHGLYVTLHISNDYRSADDGCTIKMLSGLSLLLGKMSADGKPARGRTRILTARKRNRKELWRITIKQELT
jgi:hypothetical protein